MAKPLSLPDTALTHTIEHAAQHAIDRLAELPPSDPPPRPEHSLPPTSAALPEHVALPEASHVPEWLIG